MKCPRCMMSDLAEDVGQNALSRVADIYICSDCGMDESVRDFSAQLRPRQRHEWPVLTRYSFHNLVNG